MTCVEKAFALVASGADHLDAVVAGVNIVELDPEDSSVGYGGLPNADGKSQYLTIRFLFEILLRSFINV